MTRTERDLRRLWAKIAEQNGAWLSAVGLTRGGHFRGTFIKNSASAFVIAAATPRTSATAVIEAEARRALRGIAP